MSRRAVIMSFAALAVAFVASAMPLGLRLAQQAAAAEKGAAEKDPLLMTEAEAYAYYAPDTAVLIDLQLLGTQSVSINPSAFYSAPYTVTIDWGDGTVQKDLAMGFSGTGRQTHVYADGMRYAVVRVSYASAPFSGFSAAKGVIRVLRWADDWNNCLYARGLNVSDLSFVNCEAFPDGKLARWPKNPAGKIGSVYQDCAKLAPATLPEWPENVTVIDGVYHKCTGLTVAEFPKWPDGVEEIWSTYGGCTNIVATEFPEWPKSLTKVDNSGWSYGVYDKCAKVKATRIPDWPDGVTRIGSVYAGCAGLTATNLPAWPKALTDVGAVYQGGTYAGCTGIKATGLPDWPDGVTTLRTIYYGCTGLTGSIPQKWPDGVTRIGSVYAGCAGLTGSIPQKWPDGVTTISGVYSGCTGLTGSIPQKWPDGVTTISGVYGGCTGLTFTELPAWPETLVTCNSVYYGTFPSWKREQCKGLVIPKWPAKVREASYTYRYCGGLVGEIPEWSEAMKTGSWSSVSFCYDGCSGLTNAWTNVASELMPTNITDHTGCVSGTAASLRALFYSDWGGSRPKEQ